METDYRTRDQAYHRQEAWWYKYKRSQASGIGKLLAGKYTGDHGHSCHRKKQYTFNGALQASCNVIDRTGHFDISIYFCLNCHTYHIGHQQSLKNQERRICVWCGNHIRPKNTDKHANKCGRVWTD